MMNLFLQIHFLLAVSAVLFLSAEKISRTFSARMSFLRTLRIAQLILILSMVLPFFLSLLPKSSLEGVKSQTFTAYSEGISQALPVREMKREAIVSQNTREAFQEEIFTWDYSLIMISFWFFGAMYFIFRFFKNFREICRTLASSTPIRSFRRTKIVASEKVTVPFSAKLPNGNWVVIPVLLLGQRKDLELAIKHEIQHHRQGDTGWAIFMEFIGCFLFFNPAVYLWKNIITELQELSCDESLIGRKEVSSKDYGSCLLRVAEAALEHRQMYAGTTSMAAIIKDSNYFKKFLMRRIEMITEKRVPSRPWISYVTSLMIFALSVAAAVGAEKIVRGNQAINPGSFHGDKDIQKITDDILLRSLARMNATAGFIIVAEPSTGKILAVANKDLKKNRKGHWVLNQLMEPGSIAKPIMVAEVLEQGKTDLSSKHNCENGKYVYGGVTYSDWKKEGWSTLTTSETIELSSNICSIKIAQLIGEKELDAMLDKFGFGENGTTRNFPEARPGERPVDDRLLLPKVAVGLGLKSSPLEILQVYGAIANGGKLMDPVSHDGEAKILRTVLSKNTIQQMNQLLQNAVLHGTGKKAQSDLYSTAGKTSTIFNEDFAMGSKEVANQAGFMGFAPAKKPLIQVYVGIFNPNTDGTGAHGGAHAAPVFKEVVENVLTHLRVAPDRK